jgi:hypothetical protein
MLDFAQMDTQVPAFEVPTELNLVEAATPLPCPRLMGALVMALLMAPSFLLAPAINRRRV